MRKKHLPLLLALTLLPPFARADAPNPVVLRVGYFPNITHAQGVIGAAGTRAGGGWFEQRLGPGISLQWFPFNAGPSAMEALFAGGIDISYVGPNPALNAHIRSNGAEVRVLAGACEGGAALLVRPDAAIAAPADFRGKALGTPQFGNTQDIAARVWLKRHGLRVTPTGGDVRVLPASNPDLLVLFSRKKLDAAWTVEPWVSRLETEAGARVFLEQRDTPTTLLVASVAALRHKRVAVEKFLAAHRALTLQLANAPADAREKLRAALSAETRFTIKPELVANAWPRLRFTDALTPAQMETIAAEAEEAGFLPKRIPLTRLFIHQP